MRRGFGLIAAVIAALLLAIAVPPLVGLFSGSYRTLAASEAALLAEVAASDLLERVTDPTFAMNHIGDRLEVPSDPAHPETVSNLRLMEPFASHYRAKAIVTIERATGHKNPATDKEEQGLLEVRVEMTWDEGKIPHSLDTRTMVGDLEALRPSS
ncbi:MAG: hypothetical protein HY303_18290 [Candidatus Wallbacteria bacterium]|nr:hypothetical protein [Candidatus Wallbacteria bacterium]